MAIDTKDKRSSAILHWLPFRGLLPDPDSAISQADRQHTAYAYRGILASAASPVTLVGRWSKVIEVHSGQGRIITASGQGRIETHSGQGRIEVEG